MGLVLVLGRACRRAPLRRPGLAREGPKPSYKPIRGRDRVEHTRAYRPAQRLSDLRSEYVACEGGIRIRVTKPRLTSPAPSWACHQ